MCTVSGWGSETVCIHFNVFGLYFKKYFLFQPTSADIPIKLRSVDVPIVSQKLCRDEYKELGVTVTDKYGY